MSPKRCPRTGRFLPRTVASMVAEHNRTIRHNRICRMLDLATSALICAGLVAAYAAFAVAMFQIGGARRYECESCGENRVYGMEELLIMGALKIEGGDE